MSLRKQLAIAALLVCGASGVFADTIQLKDQDAITGKILAQKPDAIVVDVGYTVLLIPRSVITALLMQNESQMKLVAPLVDNGQFYDGNPRPFVARDVSSLVKQIGESVVQVRTPEGLGSGFFINADGYLITVSYVHREN